MCEDSRTSMPAAMKAVTASRTTSTACRPANYTQAHLQPRAVQQGRAEPLDPPTTWATGGDERRKTITKLGHVFEGLGRLQRGQQRRLAFRVLHGPLLNSTAVNTNNAGPPTAGFDQRQRPCDPGRAAHAAGSPSNANGCPPQGLAWGALQQQFAAGKLCLYIAAPDDIYNVIEYRPTRATSTTSAWARCPA